MSKLVEGHPMYQEVAGSIAGQGCRLDPQQSCHMMAQSHCQVLSQGYIHTKTIHTCIHVHSSTVHYTKEETTHMS